MSSQTSPFCNYIVIKTEAEAAIVLQTLQKQSVVAIDLESAPAGSYGTLCLVQLCARDGPVYLLDPLEIGPGKLLDAGLRNLLEDPIIRKVLFSAPQDAALLSTQFGVRLRGIWDLQVLDYQCANATRGRLSMGPSAQIPPLPSLRTCLERFRCVPPAWLLCKERGKMAISADSKVFLIRPLPMELLNYAALDVRSLFPLLDSMHQWVNLNLLPNQSRLETASDLFAYSPRSKLRVLVQQGLI